MEVVVVIVFVGVIVGDVGVIVGDVGVVDIIINDIIIDVVNFVQVLDKVAQQQLVVCHNGELRHSIQVKIAFLH